MKQYLLLIALLASLSEFAIGQQSDTTIKPTVAPVPVEIFPETRGLYYQMIINKLLAPKSRFGIFNITAFRADYNNDPSKNEFYTLATLTAKVWKGFSIIGGGTIISVPGFHPTIGPQYTYISKNVVLILIGRVDLTETHNIENLALFQFNPKFSKKWGAYMRVQELFNYNPEANSHARSALYLRLGLSYNSYQFGFGTNVDFYGPDKINENSYGGFLSVYLF
jgi:hypothetical protein